MNGENTFRARLSDAAHPAGIGAEVRAGAGGLALSTPEGDSFWAWDSVRLRSGSFGGGVQLEQVTSGSLLSFPDEAVLAAFRVHAPQRAPGRAGTTARRAGHPLVLLGVSAAALAVAAWLALPLLAASAARRVPVAWEEQFGEAVVGSMAPEALRVHDPRIAAPIEALVARLAAAQESPYHFRVVVSSDSAVNAFAAPGGWIVVNQGLIRLAANGDELAGVLAHEMEHVRLRHVTVSLFQQLSLQLLLAVIVGEAGGVAGNGAGVASRLSGLAFSRGAELEADAGGAAMMREARLDPAAMISILERMRTRAGDAPLEMLSTHPATPARTEALRARIAGLPAGGTTPSMAPSVWRSLEEAAAPAR